MISARTWVIRAAKGAPGAASLDQGGNVSLSQLAARLEHLFAVHFQIAGQHRIEQRLLQRNAGMHASGRIATAHAGQHLLQQVDQGRNQRQIVVERETRTARFFRQLIRRE